MHVVQEPDLAEDLAGLPLTVVFADAEAIAAIKEAGEGALALVPPYHVSDDDAYLVLPDDVGLELVDMFEDGDLDLIAGALADGIVAIGAIERGERQDGKRRVVSLHVEECAPAAELLTRMPYAERIGFGRGVDPVPLLNALPHAHITVASAFVDEAGTEKMLRKREWCGAAWTPPRGKKELAGVDPTYAWTQRDAQGHVGIEMALFVEYEELVAVLRPARLVSLEHATLAPVPA
jgi:hypothetical protein